jgi:5-keto-L-gluconate epimerase
MTQRGINPRRGRSYGLPRFVIEVTTIENHLREAGDRLWHIHIADSNRNYPGSGHINYEGIFGTLKQMKYGGYISAEVRPLPDPDTAAVETIAFLKKWLN